MHTWLLPAGTLCCLSDSIVIFACGETHTTIRQTTDESNQDLVPMCLVITFPCHFSILGHGFLSLFDLVRHPDRIASRPSVIISSFHHQFLSGMNRLTNVQLHSCRKFIAFKMKRTHFTCQISDLFFVNWCLSVYGKFPRYDSVLREIQPLSKTGSGQV